MTKNITFIGLGNMGAPMAANLSAAGHHVTGVDPVACPEGITMASDATDAAKGADVVLTMLPNGAILRDVAAQILPVMEAGTCLLYTSDAADD